MYFYIFFKSNKTASVTVSPHFVILQSICIIRRQSLFELLIRRAYRSNRGSKVCRFALWMCLCSAASNKTHTQSARGEISGTSPLCNDLKCKQNHYISHHIIHKFDVKKTKTGTSDRFMTSRAQGSSFGMIVRFAIR